MITADNKSIVSTNVDSFNKVKVVILSGSHPEDQVNYAKDLAFNREFLRNHFTQDDMLMPENCAENLRPDLLKMQVGDLTFSAKQITSWEDPEFIKKAEQLKEQLQRIHEAIQRVENVNTPPKEQLESYNELFAFNKVHKPFKEWNNDDKTLYLLRCQVKIAEMRRAFILKTFPERQTGAMQRMDKALTTLKGRLYILMGPLHVDTDHPDFRKEAQRIKTHLKNIPHLILNPGRITAGSSQ